MTENPHTSSRGAPPGAALSRISVLIPCYNAEAWIGRTIDSILADPFGGMEIVVVDDLSTDGSLDVVRGYGDRVVIDGGVKRGAAGARNRAYALSRGDAIVFCDADDYYAPGALSAMAEALVRDSADVCLAGFRIETSSGVREERAPPPPGISPRTMLCRVMGAGWSPPIAVMWRRAFYDALGGWREDLLRNDDGELMARAMFADPVITSAPTAQAVYFQHASPARVSARVSAAAIQSNLATILEVGDQAAARGYSEAMTPLARQAYELAREAYQHGYWALGDQALACAGRFGFRGHLGSPGHRLASAALGLKGKERAARLVRRLRGGGAMPC